MKIFFLSAECFPIAKVGGLADVVGTLPKHLNQSGLDVSVVMPRYDLPWFKNKKLTTLYKGQVQCPKHQVNFDIQHYQDKSLGFEVYFIDIPGVFDRKGIYADEDGVFFQDEAERYIAFQRAFLQWVNHSEQKPDIIHCHDHHTGLVPFMIQYAYEFENLKDIPTVFSIHNERYQGAFPWDKANLLPEFDTYKSGMMDWDNWINPMAAGIKCSWKLNTVSPSYMGELQSSSYGLEWLFQNEASKSIGILNGIDTDVWNPYTDELIKNKLVKSLKHFKSRNKSHLIEKYKLSKNKPLISFIGRFALEKGADVLADDIDDFLATSNDAVFLILGTGIPEVEERFKILEGQYPKKVKALVTYDEKVSHRIYAGSDFIIMPSRVEPCGLNQMYAMRYSTIPIVRNIGGLKDSVKDLSKKNSTGIKFEHVSKEDINDAIYKAITLYKDKSSFDKIRERCLNENFSWEKSAKQYISIYNELTQ